MNYRKMAVPAISLLILVSVAFVARDLNDRPAQLIPFAEVQPGQSCSDPFELLGEPYILCRLDGEEEIPTPEPTATETNTPASTDTDTPTAEHPHETETAEPTATDTDTPTATATDTQTPTHTATSTPSQTPTLTSTPGNINPFVSAPLCTFHDPTKWHGLWNSMEGCHNDHEHGTDPFTFQVTAAFPGFNLLELLCNNEIPHCNPSGPMEFTHKHGGFKIDVMLANPHGCQGGFEGANWCVKKAIIGYHGFGDYAVEMEARIHSTWALITVCNPANPSDCGTIFTIGHQDYGQVTVPYQGTVMAYPNSFTPPYASGFGPYFTIDCVGPVSQCRSSLQFIRDRNLNVNSKWTSKRTGGGARPEGCVLFCLLWDVRDVPRVFDWLDQVYPYTFKWVCSSDGGATFNPFRCRYNNSTTSVSEVAGTIPDCDLFDGVNDDRCNYEGFADRFGNIRTECTEVGLTCFPIKLVNVPVNIKYGDYLDAVKASNNGPVNTPERDIYFCGSAVCTETSPGAVPSGWIGSQN